MTNQHGDDEHVGESVCYAHLVCASCGRMLDDVEHDAHCTLTSSEADE